MKANALKNLNGIVLNGRDNSSNGRMKKVKIYVSADQVNWGDPVFDGHLDDMSSDQVVRWNAQMGQYVKIVNYESYGDGNTTSLAEIRFLEAPTSNATTFNLQKPSLKVAFFNTIDHSIQFNRQGFFSAEAYNLKGELVWRQEGNSLSKNWSLAQFAPGTYQVVLKEASNSQVLSIRIK